MVDEIGAEKDMCAYKSSLKNLNYIDIYCEGENPKWRQSHTDN